MATDTHVPVHRTTRLSRGVLWSIGFLLAFGGVVLGTLHALDVAEVEYGNSSLTPSVNTRARIHTLASPRARRWKHVGFLGDSTAIAYPQGHKVTQRLEEALQARVSKRYRVHFLGAPGMGSFEYYTISHAIAEVHPDQIVLAFNFASLSPNWRDRWARPEMIGWIPGNRIPEALRLPLHHYGVTFDRLLLAFALIQSDQIDAWYAYDRAQIRTGKGIVRLRSRLQGKFRGAAFPRTRPRNDPGKRRHLNPASLRGLYGAALRGAEPDHPTIQFLERALETFHAAGIPTLLYTVPFDIEHLERIGLYDQEGLARTLRTLQEVARATEADFLDLHDLLPTEGFRDAGGHFTYDEDLDGPQLIADRLATILSSPHPPMHARRAGRGR